MQAPEGGGDKGCDTGQPCYNQSSNVRVVSPGAPRGEAAGQGQNAQVYTI